MVELEAFYIAIGIVASTLVIVTTFWKLNKDQKQEIKDYVNYQVNDPEIGVRPAIKEVEDCLTDKIKEAENRVNEKINEVKTASATATDKIEGAVGTLMASINDHIRESERKIGKYDAMYDIVKDKLRLNIE